METNVLFDYENLTQKATGKDTDTYENKISWDNLDDIFDKN